MNITEARICSGQSCTLLLANLDFLLKLNILLLKNNMHASQIFVQIVTAKRYNCVIFVI